MSRKFEKDWEGYMDAVYPDGMVDEQYKQVRQAFFSGALSLALHMAELDGQDEPTLAKGVNALIDEIKASIDFLLEDAEMISSTPQ